MYDADPLNLFVLVEAGDHHASILDGDSFERLARFPTRYALHGGPKFSPEGRYVYFASRDGWITKYDLWNLATVAEVRAGLNTRNAAVSSDGRYVMVGNYLPHSVVILDADLAFVKLLPVVDREGKRSSRVSAVYDAAPRKSFVVALKDIPEIWEVSYDPKAPDIPVGVIHDFQYREGAFAPGFLNARRSFLQDTLDDFFFTQDYSELMGASREAGKGQVVHLDVRRKIADLDLPGMPHLGSGITFAHGGRTVMATPNLKQGVVSVIDTTTWKPVTQVATHGPGFFMRSHDATPYAWVDGMMGPRKDTLQVIDKRTLEVVGEVTPSPGKTAAHVEFDRRGKYALVSVWEIDGAVVVYDAATWKEVRRIPASKPVGKYNVANKIARERAPATDGGDRAARVQKLRINPASPRRGVAGCWRRRAPQRGLAARARAQHPPAPRNAPARRVVRSRARPNRRRPERTRGGCVQRGDAGFFRSFSGLRGGQEHRDRPVEALERHRRPATASTRRRSPRRPCGRRGSARPSPRCTGAPRGSPRCRSPSSPSRPSKPIAPSVA